MNTEICFKFSMALLAAAMATAAAQAAPAATAATPRSLSPQELHQLAPLQRLAYVRALAARQAERRARGTAQPDLDTIPPVLGALTVAKAYDPSKLGAMWPIDYSGSDEESGLTYVDVYFKGPSGQVTVAETNFLLGRLAASGRMDFALGRPGIEPGSWTVTDAYVYDDAGNVAHYDAAALAAMGGNLVTKVKNSAYDVTAPTVAAGHWSATTVSRGTYQPGTANQPVLSVALDLVDTGDKFVSGISQVYVDACTLPRAADCVSLSGYADSHAARTTLAAGTRIAANQNMGDYHVRSIQVYDAAGNTKTYTSTEFGGETDFSTLLDATVISIIK